MGVPEKEVDGGECGFLAWCWGQDEFTCGIAWSGRCAGLGDAREWGGAMFGGYGVGAGEWERSLGREVTRTRGNEANEWGILGRCCLLFPS